MDEDKVVSAWCTADNMMARDCPKWMCSGCHHRKMPTKDEFEAVMLKPPEAKTVVGRVKEDKADHLQVMAAGHFDSGVTYVMEEMEPRRMDYVWVYDKFGVKNMWPRKWFEVEFE